jgi:DNA integrity scanning protein DisA with diadenylate cyclase activity
VSGRWRLTEFPLKYRQYRELIRDGGLADRLMQTALNLREARRGAIFVVLNDAGNAGDLINSADKLACEEPSPDSLPAARQALNDLLRNRNAIDMPSGMLESVAAMDGAIVVTPNGDLIAVGALLRASGGIGWAEGARTTAAISASQHATVLKVSQDGEIALLSRGRVIWSV